MFDFFHFSLPRAVTEQLVEHLDRLKPSPLTGEALVHLANFQFQNKTAQGVYVIYQDTVAVYAGKADGLAERLGEHLWKIRGRQGIDLNHVGFKAALLDLNWSTSANEDLLIKHFKNQNECAWNGNGLGPKDPGRNRDGGKPNWFDRTHPVREDYPIEGVEDDTTVGKILAQVKAQVPYLFRYDVPAAEQSAVINISKTDRTVRSLAVRAGQALGAGWQLTLFKNGLTLYKGNRSYEHGIPLL